MTTYAAASEAASTSLINSDLKQIGDATMKLANHVINLGVNGGLTTPLLQWSALILIIPIYYTLGMRSYFLAQEDANSLDADRRVKLIWSLFHIYTFITFPNWLFGILRGQIGQWLALIGLGVVSYSHLLRGEGAEVYQGLFLVIVVSPGFVAGYVREGWIGVIVCVGIGCYVLQDHIRAGGFRETFIRNWGIFNSICIALLFVYPLWLSITLI